jgi:exonuclease III
MGATKSTSPQKGKMDTQQKNIIMPDRSRPGITTTAHPTGGLQDGADKYATGTTPITTPITHITDPNPNPINPIKLPKEGTILGTWNVRTLYQCGKVKELTHELQRYKWDIIGLAEVRWTGFGETSTDEGHKIWFSGDQSKHQYGVGFIVRKEVVKSVISCSPISSRLISIRISAKPHNLTVIQVYAPTSDHEEDEVESFYEGIEQVIKKTPKKDILIIMGDWNAKVGPDSFEQWSGTVGKFGWGETNERGIRLLEFAQSHRLTIANTLHPHKKSRTVTWQSPGGSIQNQIDYILVPRRFKSSINKAQTRSFPGVDIGSDHNLVLTRLKLKLKSNRSNKSSRIRFNLDRLKDPKVAEIFQAQVGGKFAALTIVNQDVDNLANTLKEVLISTAEEVIGRKRSKKQQWVTDEILDLCDKRRTLKKEKQSNKAAVDKYRMINRKIRKEMKQAKEEWIDNQCRTMEDSMATGNSKKAYETLRNLTKSQQMPVSVIDDSNGKLLTERTEVLGRWTEYCIELYNHKINPDTGILQNKLVRELNSLPVMPSEVEEAVRSLKGDKSPGVDDVPAELLKHGGEAVSTILTTICKKIWEDKKWPKEWTQSLIIPLPKKGNLKQCQNYRTISLISHPSKVMLKVLLKRLKPMAEEILAEEQAGFRPGRSTIEQIFNCRLLIEKHLQHQRELHHNFIDFKKAFDRVWHEGLWQVMRSYNIEEGLIRVIEALYNDASSAVKLNSCIGDFFKMSIGVRQGCILSPTLFNIFLEKIMQETLDDHQTSISIGGRPLCNLRFADDIDLLAGSNEELQELSDKLVERAGSYGMEISTEKSKVMINTTDARSGKITLNQKQLEEVNNFKYLGAILSADGSCEVEIRARIGTATAAMARLNRIWSSKSVSLATKLRLYRALVKTIVLYGCETWTLLVATEKKLQAFENKCMRRLLRISYLDHKTNEYVWEKIESITGPQETIMATIKRRKLTWFGHVVRHNNLPKTILQGTVQGGRRRGRQRKCWFDNIKEWTNLQMSELLTVAQNRQEWRNLTAEVSIHSPQRPQRSRD